MASSAPGTGELVKKPVSAGFGGVGVVEKKPVSAGFGGVGEMRLQAWAGAPGKETALAASG
jgi:hypothetical protein